MLGIQKPCSRAWPWRYTSVSMRQIMTKPFCTGLVPTTVRECRRKALFQPISVDGRRYKVKETGEAKTGHIVAAQNESIFFIDNIFPLATSNFLGLPYRMLVDMEKFLPRLMKRLNSPDSAAAAPKTVAERALPDSLPIKITEILPRVGEGGVFVKISYDPNQKGEDIEKTVKGHLKQNPIKPWFNPFSKARAFLVQGRPWLEDLYRLPSPSLKVEFVPPSPGQPAEELSQETLYTLFRRYGKLQDIKPQPTDSKDLPKYAFLQFMQIRHAAMAKNCMHGYRVTADEGGGDAGTVLKLAYQQKKKPHIMWSWLASHPRIIVPLLVAVLGTITVAVFDPIRTFFVKTHVTQAFYIGDNRIYKWFRSQASKANDLLHLKQSKTEDVGLRAIWADRKDDIEQIQTWLMESADTFIVIQGPRGSGKRELVMDQALHGRKNTLFIDCKVIQEAKGDSATICAAAAEVGYRPVFSWMNSISSLVDLAAQGTIGTKTGFSETLDTQLANIWQNTYTALRQVALQDRRKDDKDASLGDDEYLDAHPEKRPVVVVDNFLHKSHDSSIVYDKISEWAASLTTTNVAHVIFCTTDVSYPKSLSKALPNRVFRAISLGDCSIEAAKRFVFNHLDADAIDTMGTNDKLLPSQTREDLGELDSVISILGGRLADLEFLARRIKTGESPRKAVDEIIEQSASEILKIYILDVEKSRNWTPEQAWLLIRSLAENDTLRYNGLLLSDTYKSNGEATLQALEQAELISIVSSNGRPNSIKAGKPVYTAAFKRLTEDHVLKARLDLSILIELIKIETKGIDQYETELNSLASLHGSPPEIRGRTLWLLEKLKGAHERVESYERESGGLKQVLKREF